MQRRTVARSCGKLDRNLSPSTKFVEGTYHIEEGKPHFAQFNELVQYDTLSTRSTMLGV